jgi:coniferyl-aldehyde dehydrogenase
MTETTTAELHALFARQKQAFSKDRNPALEIRLARLRRLDEMLIAYREKMQQALTADFSSHHPLVTDLFESGAVIARAQGISSPS